MPPKRKAAPKTKASVAKASSSATKKVPALLSKQTVTTTPLVASSDLEVYVVTLDEYYHGDRGNNKVKVIGVYNSKAAAAASLESLESVYDGNVDEALDEANEEERYKVDNRRNPPDNGVLAQLGNREEGEGDYCKVLIKKYKVTADPLYDPSKPKNKKKKTRPTYDDNYTSGMYYGHGVVY